MAIVHVFCRYCCCCCIHKTQYLLCSLHPNKVFMFEEAFAKKTVSNRSQNTVFITNHLSWSEHEALLLQGHNGLSSRSTSLKMVQNNDNKKKLQQNFHHFSNATHHTSNCVAFQQQQSVCNRNHVRLLPFIQKPPVPINKCGHPK